MDGMGEFPHWGPLLVADLPFSAVADTLLIPLILTHDLRAKLQDWAREEPESRVKRSTIQQGGAADKQHSVQQPPPVEGRAATPDC
jgi:hypothetical protein